MAEHAEDPGVFIRSMATRGQLGGLAGATPQALRVLDAAGCDVVLIETVGVGQSEVDVVALADTTVVLLAPGMGDGVQAAKAGILEVADVFVVNKADRDGAAQTVRELRHMIGSRRGGRVGGCRCCRRWLPAATALTSWSPRSTRIGSGRTARANVNGGAPRAPRPRSRRWPCPAPGPHAWCARPRRALRPGQAGGSG